MSLTIDFAGGRRHWSTLWRILPEASTGLLSITSLMLSSTLLPLNLAPVWDMPCEPWMPPSPPCSEVDIDDIYRSIDGLFFYEDKIIAEEDLPPYRESITHPKAFRRLPGSSRLITNSSLVKTHSSSRNSINENGVMGNRERSVDYEGVHSSPLRTRLPITGMTSMLNSSVDTLHHIDVLSPPESSPPTPSSSSTIHPNEYASSSVYSTAMISALNGSFNEAPAPASTPFPHPQKSIDECIESVRRSSVKKPLIKYISWTGPPETAHTILRAGPKTNEEFVVPEHGMEAPDYEGLPWTCAEDFKLLLAVTEEHKLTSELIAQNDGLLINWDFVACCVNEEAYHYRSPRQCCLRYQSVILRTDDVSTTFDTSLSFKRSRKTSSSSSSLDNSCWKRRDHSAPTSIHFDVEQRNQELTSSFKGRVETMAKACAHRKQVVYSPLLVHSTTPQLAQQLYSLNGGALPPHQLQRMQELAVDCTQMRRPLDLLLAKRQQRSSTVYTATPTQRLQKPKY